MNKSTRGYSPTGGFESGGAFKNFHRQFETFDPLRAEAVGFPFGVQLSRITSRARALVMGRTRSEVTRAAALADWMIETCFQQAHAEGRDIRHETEVGVLKGCLGEYKIDDDLEFPDGQAHEYFAALALWKVADATESVHETLAEMASHADQPLAAATGGLIYASNYALRAMEAVCWAEHLSLAEQSGEVAARKRISLRAKKAAIARHMEHGLFKADVFAWCDRELGHHRSLDSATEAILKAKLFPSAKFSTVRAWLTEYRKLRSARRPDG